MSKGTVAPGRVSGGRDRVVMRRFTSRLGWRIELAVMLAPLLVGLGLLVVVPVALVVPVAFTDYDLLSPPRPVGLANFARLLRDPEFLNGLRASLAFIALGVPLRVAGALALALLLARPGRGIGLARVAVYVPTVVPEVAYALLWLAILNPLFGPLNGLAGLLFGGAGYDGSLPPNWLLHPVAAPLAVVLMLAWTVGEGFVVLLAALQDIPRELHEAAAIDGAGGWTRFRLVTLPLLAPLLLLLACRDTVFSFRGTFVASVIVTGGGPYYATTYLPLWLYQVAADQGRFGYAAAMTIVLFLITGLVILLQFGLVHRWRAAYFDV